MDEIFIRKARIQDLPYLYEICLKTGDYGKDAGDLFSDPYLIGQYYAAPYLLYPAGIGFVAGQNRRPKGYIIAVPDSNDFNRWMEETWLPPLRECYPKPIPKELIRSENEKRILEIFHNNQLDNADKDLYANYPAHLHIDLLPELQGKGTGRKLMDTLFAELGRQKVTGVHLGVSKKNPAAVAFYHKLEFAVFHEHEWGFTMIKDIYQTTG
ncbi:MAG: GNAT family N-acetyltransferase [Treponema sp.]|nr:GNAT family N-acetyltransferase [Treponema sp.]